jgi:hypothetical protein
MRSMRVLTTLLAATITAAAVTLTTLSGPSGGATTSIWQVEKTVNPEATASAATNSTFASVSASGPDEAWAVGTFSNTDALDQPLAEHWNGTTCTRVTVPAPAGQGATLSGVDDLSPTDAWAVGASGGLTLIEHWNGTSWSIVPSPNPATGIPGDGDSLAAIAGTSPNDLWAAGSDVTEQGGGEIQLLFEHFNGATWTAAASPAGDGGGVSSAITAISSDDFWAVGSFAGGGSNTLAAHWNGTKWSIVPVPDITGFAKGGGLNHLTGVSADGPDDVWASGYAADVDNTNLNVPGLLHWNGTSWTAATVPTLGKEGSLLFGVQVLSPTDAWAVGQTQGLVGNVSTLTEQFNGSVWTIVKSPDPGMEVSAASHTEVPFDTLGAVTGARGGNLFTVGQRFGPAGQCCDRTLAISTTQG